MNGSVPSEPELLKSILEPLLDDFQYWFEQSRSLLETENISFLSQEQHSDLLARVTLAEAEVRTAQMLFQATSGKVGIEPATLVPWHRLVAESWQVSRQCRSLASATAAVETSGDPNLDSSERSDS